MQRASSSLIAKKTKNAKKTKHQAPKSLKKDATLEVNLLFLVSSTCFGRCFRPSSGAIDCIYSI
jgi:hypothetical protein